MSCVFNNLKKKILYQNKSKKIFPVFQYPIMMGPEVAPAADKLVRLAEVVGWVRDYVKEGKFAAGTGKQLACSGTGTSTKSRTLKL